MKEKLVVVGNGMAGMRAVEELLKLAPDKYAITVFGAEPHPNYNRILLSPVLTGEKQFREILLNDDAWYAEHGITLHKGKTVVEIDRRRRLVKASDGTASTYDRLLLATGSNPFILPVPGKDLPGVIGFRDFADVETMLTAAKEYRHAVVIGGGLLGLEAANGLLKQGMKVTVIHLVDTLMERQLDRAAGRMLKKALEAAGIHCEKGIVVSDTLQTYDPRVYAVGECVQHRGLSYGLVAPLFEQAKVCANHLAELGYARYEGSITSTKLKITGIDLFSAGDFSGDDSTDEIVMQDAARGVYKKVVLDGNKIRGAGMYGDTLDGAWYFQMMRDGTDVSAFRERLLFGQAHLGDAGHGDIKQRINLMPDDAEICGCNGVCKGTIVKAIGEKKLFTLDEVRAHTKASSSCGSCTGLVEALLATTAGGDYSTATKKKPMCPCTDHSHDELRIAIRAQSLKTIPAVMQQLQWKTPNGCGKCRPALNFYLLTAWPGEYVDDNQSRFINERAHANIQKDGTYSVVPRIWGGETTPRELRSLAEIAEKYKVPTVHITGGQRIDFLGVKKEPLPLIWGDLSQAGFVSGHAYGKAIRTVKTCVGSQWCRFGTQDSTTLGIQLEKMAWGAWTPHKFKLGVSGCPRNCAEATIKDFGVVCVDSGYELHVGGNGGVKVRVTDFLCRVKTPEEALEYCAAFLQLYREEAHYLERTAPWIERVGLAYVKQRVVENEAGRKELADRFHYSQKFSQDDPWAARAQGAERHEFIPLKMGVK